MKTCIITLFTLTMAFFATHSFAQDDPSKRASPPATATGTINGVDIVINYSSPAVKGRTIWGGLEPYNQVWRAGANEATTIAFSKDVKVEGQFLPKGTYAFFVIPTEKDWTIIFNKTPQQWGAYKYDQSKDALRAQVKPNKKKDIQERLVYTIDSKGFTLSWEYMDIPVRVQ